MKYGRTLHYLKRFNEAKEETKLTEEQVEELKDLCETSLVYLLDEDFELNIDSRYPGLTGNVSFYLKRKSGFTWNEIKDYFIPFLQRLSNKYVIEDRIMFSFNDAYQMIIVKDNDYLSVKSLIKDEHDFDDTLIRTILMRICEEK
jgi:uncharacterized protein YqkB